MKLRIKANTIRLRLTKTEVEQFETGGFVKESVHFGPGADQHMHYMIMTEPGIDDLSVDYKNNTLKVLVPGPIAGQWTQTDQVGMEAEVNTGEGLLHILVEKDFQCLHRNNAEEPDNYAHPLAE